MTENEKIEEKNEAEVVTDDVSEAREVVFEEALEAILFAAGHPISYATLARVFDMTPAKVRDRVFEYSLKYNAQDIPRGVILLTYNDNCQLCTKKFYLTEIREALGIKKSGTLSTSSLEARAIVAYNQPVTRVFVDTLRRADSSYAMNNLIDRGLIESKGRLDVPGRPMLYGTTTDFLRSFGLKSIADLPTTTDEMNAMFDKVKRQSEDSENIEGQISLSDLENEASVATEQKSSPEIFDEPSAEDDIISDI